MQIPYKVPGVPFTSTVQVRSLSPGVWYAVYERIGSGPMQPCKAYPDDTPMKSLASIWLRNQVTEYRRAGYEVEFNAANGWFIATHPTEPLVQGFIWEVTE